MTPNDAAGAQPLGDWAANRLTQQHNRPTMRLKQRGLFWPNVAETLDHCEIRDHHGERLILALFALTQPLHRLHIERIAGQMIAAQALNRQNIPGSQKLCRLQNRVRARRQVARVINKAHLRATGGAGIWLSMEAPILRVFIFRLAVWGTSGKHASSFWRDHRGHL